jgi:hypothetical protein
VGLGFKYHIATIVAVFFALTVGLVIGSLFISPQVSDSQKRLLVSLRETMEGDVQRSRDQIKRYQEFFTQNTSPMLQRKLFGATVTIVQTGDYPNAVASVREALRQAHAQVSAIIRVEHTFNRSDEILKPALAALKSLDPAFRPPSDRTGLAKLVLATLHAPPSLSRDALEESLGRENLVKIERNVEVTSPARYVVFVTGSEQEAISRPALVDAPLVAVFQNAGLSLIACEPEKVAFSDTEGYRSSSLSLPILEAVDSDMGRCALVFALLEKKKARETQLPSFEGTTP